MRVFVAEKPSLGKAIAAVLPGPQVRHKTHIISGESNVVVWCAGHILEQYLPEDYDQALKKWSLDSLPIDPDEWRMKVSPRTKDLYATVKKYARDATLIIHAGDPDREGQLLVDEVLTALKVEAPVKRILINDLNPAAVKEALGKLTKNSQYEGLRDAALGRSRADWLFGLNLTRLYSVIGRNSGYDGVLSVGRVQTPVLGLVVRRDKEIESFKSRPFYTLEADIEASEGQFTAKWEPNINDLSSVDEAGRVIDREWAESVIAAVKGAKGDIITVEKKRKTEPPPLPFSLPELQKCAARGRELSPKKTLAIAQALYEKHKLLTYPRSDCPYLPVDHWGEASEVRDAVAQSLGAQHSMHGLTDAADLIQRGRCWNDAKITAHHAIIPTKKWAPLDRLTEDEKWVYEQVALRYLLQFFPSREYEQTNIELHLKTVDTVEVFKAQGRVELVAGWTEHKSAMPEASDKGEEGDETRSRLPPVTEGEQVQCTECLLVDKVTSPPKRFNEATLLEAMTGISRFVKNPEIKKTLKETDGLGTPATQASIMDTLFQRGYLEKRKKSVFSTGLARALIDALPEPVTLPDMTANWEQQLAEIEAGAMTLTDFMAGVTSTTKSLVELGKAGGALRLGEAANIALKPAKKKPKPAALIHCPSSTCSGRLRRIKGGNGFFWGCTNYGEGCKETRPDAKGKPGQAKTSKAKGSGSSQSATRTAKVGEGCPLCSGGTIMLKTIKTGKNKGKEFHACTGYPACDYFSWPTGK